MKRGMRKVVTLPKDQADIVLQILDNGLSFDWSVNKKGELELYAETWD